jgi:two-component system invasion response regulator UvrY
MILQGLRDLIDSTTDMMVVAVASSGNEAEHLARTIPADLLILDLTLPDRNGINVLEVLRADDIDLRVLVFSMAPTSQYVASVLDVGAQGFIGKEVDSDELLSTIRHILKGGTRFPP